jgi:restriction system protein
VKGYISKTKLSELAGVAEATGRKYISDFENYFPTIKQKKNTLYKADSVYTLKAIKMFRDKGTSTTKISDIFQESGVPTNEKELQELIKNLI